MNAIKLPEPGVYPGVTRAEYDDWPFVNASTLLPFKKSASHARQAMLDPPESEAFTFGNATHVSILEPEKFDSEFHLAPKCDKRTKLGKQLWAEALEQAEGKELLTPDQWADVQGIKKAVYAQPEAARLLSLPGPTEVSIVAVDEVSGLTLKGRVDKVAVEAPDIHVLDLKTTVNAEPSWFGFYGEIAKYGHHIRAALYLDMLDWLAPAPRRYIIIGVEKKPGSATNWHFPVTCVEVIEPALVQGRKLYRRYLTQYQWCKENDTWPGYGDQIFPLELPKWAGGEDEN